MKRIKIEIEGIEIDAAEFWGNVDKSGGPDSCWAWLGGTKPNGYPRLFVKRIGSRGRRCVYAHRIALILEGVGLRGRELARHTCDNSACVNPAHLIPGDHRENTLDAIERGRLVPFKAKITPAQVIEIVSLYKLGESVYDLAPAYGITESTVRCILTGRTWRNVTAGLL